MTFDLIEMEKVIQQVVAMVVVAIMTGCATPYMTDRGRDAADIFTVAVGNGAGITARMGPVHAGLFYGKDQIGLRAGEFGLDQRYSGIGSTFDPLIVIPNPGGGPWGFWHEDYFGGLQTVPNPHGGIMSLASARAKEYSVRGNCPFVAIPVLSEIDRNAGFKYPVHFLTEVEVVIGVGKTIRLGFNPGELLDFVLGWTTIDIFGDDLEVKRQKETSNHTSDGICRPASGSPKPSM